MRRCRPVLCALLAAAATVSVVSFPVAASADADIAVVSVGSAPGHAGLLAVVTRSLTPVTSLTVHLRGPGGNLTVSDFSLPGTGDGQQTFTVRSALTSADQTSSDYLPAGTYAATVDAADAGASVSGMPAGSFPFLIQPTLTASASPTTISYGHQTVTFSGSLTGIEPGGSTPAGLGGVPVYLIDQATSVSRQVATTAADGSYTAPALVTNDPYVLHVNASTTMAAADSDQVQITASADPLQLTAKLAKSTIKYGQRDSISGTVLYQPGLSGPFRPLVGTTVTISASPGAPGITAVTGSKGGFTAALPKQTAARDWTVRAGGTALLDPAHKALALKVQLPTAFRQVEVSLSALSALTVKACLNVTSAGGTGNSIAASVNLQYARGSKGPWKKLRTIRASRGGASYCKHGTSSWQATVAAPLANGYYRLSFGGNSGLQPAASKAVHRWRYLTKITSFNISPRHVTARGAVSISGRLWRRTSSWHPYAGRKVAILFRYLGTWYIYQHEPRTNSRGFFSGRFAVYVTAQWSSQYDGDKTHFASTSRRIKVTVMSGSALPVARSGPELRGARERRGGQPPRAARVRPRSEMPRAA